MRHRPRISVVLTVFRRTDYLEMAIRSVLNQTFADLELIVTDDANTESARRICEEFHCDKRLRYRSNPNVLGAPLNIASAMKEAQGEYVTIINDDDSMELDMLEKLLAPFLNDEECILSFGDHWIMDDTGAIMHESTERNSQSCGRSNLSKGLVKNPFSLALRGAIPFVMGTLFKRAAYQENWLTPAIAGAYDYWLGIRFSKAAGNLHFVPERIMRWRTHPNSESARLDADKAKCAVYIFEALLRENIPADERKFVKRMASQNLFTLGRDRLYFSQNASARHAFFASYKYQASFKALAGVALSCLPGKIRRLALRQFSSRQQAVS